MERKDQYLVCPLPLIADLIVDPDALDRILDYGIYYSAMSKTTTFNKAASALIYCYGHRRDCVTQNLLDLFNNSNRLKDLVSWVNAPDTALAPVICELREVFVEEWQVAEPDCLFEWFRVYTTLQELNIKASYTSTLISKIPKIQQQQKLRNELLDVKGQPTFLVNAQILWDLYEQRGQLSDEARAEWAMYFGIMSLLGTKNYVATTSAMIQARMCGAKTVKVQEQLLKRMNKADRERYTRWFTRRHYERLIENMQLNHKVQEYGANRKTYLSVKLSLKELVKTADQSSRASKLRKLRELKKAALAEARASSIPSQPASSTDSQPASNSSMVRNFGQERQS